MSNIPRRYFWCDAPSPLHVAFDAAEAKYLALRAEVMELAKQIGAKDVASNSRIAVAGFIFAGQPPEPAKWSKQGRTDEGSCYYLPKKNWKEGKELAAKIAAFKPVNVPAAIVAAAGMSHSVWSGRHIGFTTAGLKDGRIYISLPVDVTRNADQNPAPEIPAYLTECAEWEMKRWFAIGRKGVEGEPA